MSEVVSMRMEREKVDRRFRDPFGEKSYGIKQLWDHHQEICRLVVQGWTSQEIADHLNYAIETVSKIRNSPVGMDLIQKLNDAANAGAAAAPPH
mgnify:CR=1 FL=1